MATFSPVSLNKSNSDKVSSPVGSNGTLLPQRSLTLDVPKQSLRGMNKPKCIKCGNIARSRCVFQSCKACCAKAENPCPIHVLKQVSTLPEKPPSASPLPEPPPSEPPSRSSSARLAYLKQLSTAHFNSLRSKRPLSRKDAVGINKWRFGKLREHIEGNIQAENEAFDRYMQNVGLLEEAFIVDQGVGEESPLSSEDMNDRLVSTIKAKLQSSTEGVRITRHRLHGTVNSALEKLHNWELNVDPDSSQEKARKKLFASRTERAEAFGDLFDKLAKARTDDDLKSCLEIKQQLYNNPNTIDPPSEVTDEKIPETEDISKPVEAVLTYSLPKLCTVIQIEQNSFPVVQYSSPAQIIQL